MDLSFIDDSDKMRDFLEMKKDDFLAFYSYLDEKEWETTLKDLKEV